DDPDDQEASRAGWLRNVRRAGQHGVVSGGRVEVQRPVDGCLEVEGHLRTRVPSVTRADPDGPKPDHLAGARAALDTRGAPRARHADFDLSLGMRTRLDGP